MTTDGFYRTGDIFKRDTNGFFYFVGRTDDMFNCGGENIFPSDVEAILLRHPAVQAASIVAVPDEIKGYKPVAFVVLRIGAIVDPDDIKRFALKNAPAYQHPRRVFVLDEMCAIRAMPPADAPDRASGRRPCSWPRWRELYPGRGIAPRLSD